MSELLNIYEKLVQKLSYLMSDQLKCTTKLILPGVGHFDYAMLKFREFPLMLSVTMF